MNRLGNISKGTEGGEKHALIVWNCALKHVVKQNPQRRHRRTHIQRRQDNIRPKSKSKHAQGN